MREIEFRGWHTSFKKWLYGGYMLRQKVEGANNYEHLIVISAFADWDIPKPVAMYVVDGDSVGQYTGLEDEEGTKIYEGDLFYDDYWEEVGVVEFDEGCFVGISGNVSRALSELHDRIRVIGNIFENPELIEEERK